MAEDAFDTDDLIPAPRANDYLLGHADAEKTLLSAHESGRLPHAWLITGPAGVGKATLAFRFARYLFTNPPDDGGLFGGIDLGEPAADGLHVSSESPIFRRVASGGHGDLFTLERVENDKGKLSTQIRVDDVREAIEFARKTAGEGGYKVIVVDGAEFMNTASENAFLKILEEPPPATVIMLISHNPGRLLATTRSRCRTLALKPLPPSQISDLLQRYAPELSPTDAAELSRLADGSIGRALAMAGVDGLSIFRDMSAVLASLPSMNISAVQSLAGRLSKAGAEDEFNTGLDLFRWWLSRIVLASSRGASGDPTLNETERDIAERAAASAILPIWLQRLDEAESLIRSAATLNLDRKQLILSLFFSLRPAEQGA